MKKLLLATAVLGALMTSAQAQAIADWEVPLPLPRPNPAATIPAEYRGEWCAYEGRPYLMRRSIERCERGSEQWLEVTAKGYEAWETVCRIFKIRRDADNMGHFITFDCHSKK